MFKKAHIYHLYWHVYIEVGNTVAQGPVTYLRKYIFIHLKPVKSTFSPRILILKVDGVKTWMPVQTYLAIHISVHTGQYFVYRYL